MTSERPLSATSATATKTLARPVLTGRTMVRKAGPRPCNLPSMKKSNINDPHHAESVTSTGTGWAKTPKPANGVASVGNTWTVPPQIGADRSKVATTKKPTESEPTEIAKNPSRKAADATVNEPGTTSSSSTSAAAVVNPFGVDINVVSWAREVSPSPPSKRAWSDASPMDFSQPVVFDQVPPPSQPTARQTGPLPDNAWRPAVVRKSHISSILKKSDSERQATNPDAVLATVPQKEVQAETSGPTVQPERVPIVDEVVQTLTMKQKALEAMKRRQEKERRDEEERKARLAAKLAALDEKVSAAKQHVPTLPISVMQRPRDHDDGQLSASEGKSSDRSNNDVQKSEKNQDAEPSAKSRQQSSDNRGNGESRTVFGAHYHNHSRRTSEVQQHSASNQQEHAERQKPAQSSRRDRHSHRRQQQVPGSKSGNNNAWTRRSDVHEDDGLRSQEPEPEHEQEANKGEKVKSEPARDSIPRTNVSNKEIARTEDKSRRNSKVPSRGQLSLGPVPPVTEPYSAAQENVVPVSSTSSKSKPIYSHRKWRAKEPAASTSSPPSPPPDSEPKLDAPVVVEDKKPIPTVNRHVERQWKSRPANAQGPTSDADKKRHRRKRSNARVPDPFRREFENAPVVGHETGALIWSAAAPVIGVTSSTTTTAAGAAVHSARAWSTPRSSSHNAELLSKQQSRAKGSPGAAFAKRALADSLGS